MLFVHRQSIKQLFPLTKQNIKMHILRNSSAEMWEKVSAVMLTGFLMLFETRQSDHRWNIVASMSGYKPEEHMSVKFSLPTAEDADEEER